MRIKSIGANKTELHLKDLTLLISYETPVALIRDNLYTKKHGLKTNKFHSVTTSKHINQWFKDNNIDASKYVATMDQEWFDNFLNDNE